MTRWNEDGQTRICRIPLPRISNLGGKARDGGVYLSGALFALGWWFFIDAAIYSKNWDDSDGTKRVSVEFVDWVPGICSTLGMIIINCVDKASLRGDTFTFSSGGETSIAWVARVILFIGFTFMAGGLAGSVSIMCIKYLIPDYGDPFAFWGICNVVQNALIMIRWVSIFTEEFIVSAKCQV
ncbi:Transmembrane protein 50A [Mortierella sp. GBA43]|nr:Transmembrane protein 50A [Mortierella sp. GBA43]